MEQTQVVRGLGAMRCGKQSYLLVCDAHNKESGTFTVRQSNDGLTFNTLTKNAKVVDINGPADDFDACRFFHVSQDGKNYYLTYIHTERHTLCIARSKNLADWEKIAELDGQTAGGKIASDYLYAGRNVMFVGGKSINMYVSYDFENWSRGKKSILTFSSSHQNEEQEDVDVQIIDVHVVESGVFVLYGVTYEQEGKNRFALHGVLLHYGNPTKVLWQSQQPIYVIEDIKKEPATPFGAAMFEEYFVSYWQSANDGLFLLKHYYNSEEKVKEPPADDADVSDAQDQQDAPIKLERVEENPILSPQEHAPWESKAVYNPTAITDEDGVHIIYRADGDALLSTWGYAFSEDGVAIKKRLGEHIYSRDVGTRKMAPPRIQQYASGNNCNGGCEDPRAVLIDGVVYVTFTAFDGWGSVRVGLTSIDFDDFKNARWNWHDTRLISLPGEINKNWVLFPEKIHGKFALLHSFYPNILIDYIDDLSQLGYGNCIKSNNQRPINPQRGWDSWFRGVGPSPIKTEYGWLVIYHAMDHRNPDRYRVGALLLDLNDPTIELCRTQHPILEPEAPYENGGIKWGVVYCCGAVVKDDTLFVYYGGSDTYVCVATAPLAQFLEQLRGGKEIKMYIH